ncbi:hypothetical protein [Mycetocola miduiensis]|uniref:Uncharacterized protein n=1 Tax=Mycetocola miduiensis TaxID=995034 RepID=A0A1I5D108_9MICO|nr:hypothetical protein [Mycetocola miduiensis]SFN92915.1 hypothetical protein SAMN05216219_2645 [Mycetocola miduiensis]
MRGTASYATARGRSIGRLAALGTAAFLTAALVTGCAAESAPEGTKAASEGTAAASPAPTETTRPTPSAVATPEAVDVILPGSCEDIYGPAMFKSLQADLPPLNDPTMADPNFSNNDELEEILRGLDYLQCTWGGAGELGIVTAVARVSDEQADEALEMMESGGFDCYEQLGGTRCVTREELEEGGVLGESHFLREGVWVSTFWLNAPIRGYTENIVEAIWE